MKIYPKNGWVMIAPDERKSISQGGILLPESDINTGHSIGRVVDAPSEFWPRDTSARAALPMPVSAGDRVVYRDYLKEMHEIEHEGKSVCLIDITDIILVVDEEVVC
jgi:co-chaperonin GroES (HSP10)